MPRLKEVTASLGISFEVGGKWHRPQFGATIEFDLQDTPEIRKRATKQVWDVVSEQINNYLAQITAD